MISKLFIALCAKDISRDNRFKDHNILCGLYDVLEILYYVIISTHNF